MASAAAAESSTDFAGLSLRELASVPSQLRSEEALLEEQVRALALANYKVHIDCVDASRRVSEELTELRSQCSEALSHGAEAEATLEGDLAHRLELLLDEELRVHRALRHERDLTDLAELPAVAEACLRHGRTDQLLDLCDVVNAMVTRHPVGTGGHAVVAAIAVGLRRARDRALNNIESALSAPALPLTAALDLVRPMRRILLQRARERAGAAPAAAAARPSPGNGPDAGLASPMSLLFAAAGSAGGQHAGPATPSADPMALGRGVLGGGRGGASHSASGTMPPPEEDAREEALERFLAARTAALRRVEADAASLPPLRRLTAVLDASRALWADVPRAADALFLRRAEAASSPVDSATPAAGTPGAGPAPASAPFVAAASVDGARRLVCWMDDSSAAAADLVAEIAPQLRSGADLVNASDAVLFAFARAAPLATDSAQARAVRDDAVAELAAADGHSEADEAAAKEQVAELTRQLIEVVPPFVAAVVGHVTRSDLVAWPGAPATAAERADCQAEAATPPGAATHAPAPSRGDRSTDALP